MSTKVSLFAAGGLAAALAFVTAVLVHIGTDRTQQLLLVRVEAPKAGG